MTVLSIHEFDIRGDHATVTALVCNMRLAHRATYLEPDEWAPAVCSCSFELHQDEQIPTNESDLCQYLTDLDLEWQLVDISDWYL